MRPIALALIAIMVLVAAAAAPAYALGSVSIQASVADQTYDFAVEPPILIKIAFEGLQPNTSVDNLALSFRDNSTTPQEVFILYVKTNGDLVLHVPIAGVTTDQLLGIWQSLSSITIRYWNDKLQVLDPYGNVLYEVTGNFPVLASIWAHSSASGTPAFTAGTITVEVQDDPAVMSKQVSEMIIAFVPLIAVLVGLAFAVGLVSRMLELITGIFR